MRRHRFNPEADAACLDGHFPGRPVVPGVVLLDAALAAFDLRGPLRITQAKFLRPCLPDMALEMILLEGDDGRLELRMEHEGQPVLLARLQQETAPGACAAEAVRAAKPPDAVHISGASCPIAVLWGGDSPKIWPRPGDFSPRTFLPRRLPA